MSLMSRIASGVDFGATSRLQAELTKLGYPPANSDSLDDLAWRMRQAPGRIVTKRPVSPAEAAEQVTPPPATFAPGSIDISTVGPPPPMAPIETAQQTTNRLGLRTASSLIKRGRTK